MFVDVLWIHLLAIGSKLLSKIVYYFVRHSKTRALYDYWSLYIISGITTSVSCEGILYMVKLMPGFRYSMVDDVDPSARWCDHVRKQHQHIMSRVAVYGYLLGYLLGNVFQPFQWQRQCPFFLRNCADLLVRLEIKFYKVSCR